MPHANKVFDRIIDLINQKSPLQKKKLERYLNEQDEQFWYLAEQFLASYEKFLVSESLDLEYFVSAYLDLCRNMLKEQTKFLRTGKYSVTFDHAYKNVYLNKAEMMSYMCGLALSQLLWKNHYEIFRFFREQIKNCQAGVTSYLEIGPGHGMFLVEALKKFNCSLYEVVDISPISIELSKKAVRYMSDKSSFVNFKEKNILDYSPSKKRFDFITMGEVLEHVENPIVLLKKIRALLSSSGEAFITTCANCPAIDHVYLFNSVEEIREMIYSCNFKIESELVLPVENTTPSHIEDYKPGYNYAGVLR